MEHYRIELRFDEKTHSFWGETRVSLWPLKDGFEVCELDAETFAVTAVRDDVGALRFEQKPGKLVVRLRRPHLYRDKTAFTVYYRARNVNVDPEKYGMAKGYDLGLGLQGRDAGASAVDQYAVVSGGRAALVSVERSSG